MPLAEKLAQKLLQIKAIKLSPQNPYTWASGLKSPIYCDNRVTLSFPEVRNLLVEGFIEKAKTISGVEVIAGVATAGIPHATLVADRLNLPLVYIRSKAKAHGRKNVIEGQLKEGAKVLVIEDLISTGGSSLQAVQDLRDAGAEVLATMAIFTYGFKRAELAFEKANCPLLTLTNYDYLLKEAVESNYLDAKYLELLAQWKADPEKWEGANK